MKTLVHVVAVQFIDLGIDQKEKRRREWRLFKE